MVIFYKLVTFPFKPVIIFLKMTIKQLAFRDYLLKKLGFEEDSFTEDFAEILQRFSFLYKKVGALTEEKYQNLSDDRQRYYVYIQGIGYVSDTFGIIDVLLWEYNKRRYRDFPLISSSKRYVSATDLANFVYCNAGFSIASTFDLPKSTLSELGTDFHEDHRLIKDYPDRFEVNKKRERVYDEENKGFFTEIEKSTLYFAGHSTSEKPNYFINKEKNFIGQPDYIFRNENGVYFVVEEKFQKSTYGKEKKFYNTHKIQLASYINYIEEYDIRYGYLVYWIYDDEYNTNIERCYIYRINNGGALQTFLNDTMKEVQDFRKKKMIEFDRETINPVKCAKCVHVLLCGHKTGRHEDLSYPYNYNYLRLYYAEYPDILKKD